MSQNDQAPKTGRISDLKVAGHLMTLDPGLFCVFHTPGKEPLSPSGLPGIRITAAPAGRGNVSVVTFDEQGWLAGNSSAALIRVLGGPGQVLVTIYQEPGSQHEAPKLQVVKLSGPDAAPAVAVAPAGGGLSAPVAKSVAVSIPEENSSPEVAAHIQRRGDVSARLGDWMGEPGSHAWIEGFGIAPAGIPHSDIEYQAVLGKGWLSPWAEGGDYCGSRGMALPILGLRVRLKGETAKTHSCTFEATFIDGTSVGPLDGTETAEAESLAPLEAFRVLIAPLEQAKKATSGRKPKKVATEKVAPKVVATVAKPQPPSTRGRGRPPSKVASLKRPGRKTR
ncbi:MAG: hypothetical protein LKH33_07970 [Acetobacter sp.]|jgi:hypothetical protein|nr:hypothetical protein [Acetobacter sp.]MCH4061799.1 hypothetical protein [Acetobacter sp.]MCH4089352.1 hypothetical protein [Acetobacter sp.]MCI1294170.1 hypothetical protein [Acetobacter sp.]MCI1320755.1 hypothetical protein [Acetobacter sp.]